MSSSSQDAPMPDVKDGASILCKMSGPSQYVPVADGTDVVSIDSSHLIRNKRPAPLTHDVSLVSEHAASIKAVAKRLQAAVDETWLTRGQSRYRQVHVLMISWEDDDLNVAFEMRRLEAIFTASYHYSVEKWEIPYEKPSTMLHRRMEEFLLYDVPDTLLIVYYAGHAIQDEQRNEPPVWISRRRDPARLPSVTVQSVLAECDSDVLLLYDCCHAVPSTAGVTGRGVKEFLTACGFEGIAPEVGQDSFTHALIQELDKASYSSISVSKLHGRLMDRLRTWKSCISMDESGQMRFNPAGKPLYERSRRKTPIHGFLINETRRRSIILSPLPIENASSGLSDISDLLSASHLSKKNRYNYQTEDTDNFDENRDGTECTQVILSIRVNSIDQFSHGDWLEWIRDVPPEATKIRVEGIYGSLSTLLLLRMPIATWNLLPGDSAYTFVGFVTTENLAPSFQGSNLTNARHKKDNEKNKNDHLLGEARENVLELEDETTEASNRNAPSVLRVATQPSGFFSGFWGGGHSRQLWTCCRCGNSGMTCAIDACPSDGHVRCTICHTYNKNRR